MKLITLFCAILLFLACLDLPIGYYTFLRIIITLGSIAVLVNEFQKDVNLLGIAFLGITVLFNPIYPIYLHNKLSWIVIDSISGILFLVYCFTLMRTKND
jgi:hypothetical protein